MKKKMDVKEISVSVKKETTTMLKPATGIAQTFTKEYLKILELTEYCRIAESTIKEYEIQINMLTASRNESAKLKVDYLNRNKVNMTNTESLLQAKNELNKYKCELKSNYIATEKAVKSQKLKYAKIISNYESDWQKTLEGYNSDGVVKTLNDIQRQNVLLEEEIERQEKLNDSTRKEFLEFEEKVERELLEKIVEFAKVMVRYRVYLGSQKEKRESVVEKQNIAEGDSRFGFFKRETPKFNFKSSSSGDDGTAFPSIDISMFDEITVPSENLEVQNEEEDLFGYPQMDQEQSSVHSEDHDDKLSLIPNDVQHLQDKNAMEYAEVHLEEANAKTDEKESQYFRQQNATDNLNHEKESFPASEKCINSERNFTKNGKESDENSEAVNASDKFKSNSQNTKNEEQIQQGKQICRETSYTENEDSLSEGSSGYPMQLKGKPFSEFEENYEYQYPKNSSMSSDDISVTQEPTTENPMPFNLFANELNKSKGESEKEGFKSFTGFFTMGGDCSKLNIIQIPYGSQHQYEDVFLKYLGEQKEHDINKKQHN